MLVVPVLTVAPGRRSPLMGLLVVRVVMAGPGSVVAMVVPAAMGVLRAVVPSLGWLVWVVWVALLVMAVMVAMGVPVVSAVTGLSSPVRASMVVMAVWVVSAVMVVLVV
ncbi:hypothetical protein AWC24_11775 [Mycolicibacter senuensis]|nr:hypothetical protein AWC24_11775 [Mycolicibacter senuensis]